MFQGHYKLERHSVWLTLAIIFAASVGGFIEIAPLFTIQETVEKAPNMSVYTPLELAGRNIYVREGCYACHSQMIRTLRDDVERYGHYSLAVESQYDHPMLWGSKRTGPDLARIGGKYTNQWHVIHLDNPRDVVPMSVMPAYPFLKDTRLRISDLSKNLAALKKLGVPYTNDMVKNAARDALAQADPDDERVNELRSRYGNDTNIQSFDGDADKLTEMDALVAYLQILGHLANPTNGKQSSSDSSK